jgi:bacterioferritin (cytochrome b1)
MPIVKKAPAILTRELRLEEPVCTLLDDYAQFIESSPDHVVNVVLKKTLWRDQEYRKWREQRRSHIGQTQTPAGGRSTKS